MDDLLFVYPRKIYFGIQEADGYLERPLRAMTAKGPRVTLIRSDKVNAGRSIEYTLRLLHNSKGLNWKIIEKCLDYGRYVGLGVWRGSGGYGRFSWDLVVK